MKRRSLLLVALLVGLGVVAISGGFIITGVMSQSGDEPANKQALEATEAAKAATAEAGPHAAKPPADSITPPDCPTVDVSKVPVGITPNDPRFQPVPGWRGSLESIAHAVSSTGTPYLIVSGAVSDDLQQGVISVEEGRLDPCAAIATQRSPLLYRTPSRAGPVTLVQIDGDAVVFQTADGATGRFDYTTGTYEAFVTPGPVNSPTSP